jgi:chloramphenicol O-acetyltransferase
MKFKSVKVTLGVKVMPDFCSSGLWNDSKNGEMIEYEDICISKELQKEFEEWIDFYDTCFKSDYSTFKKGKSKKLNEVGYELAKKLKLERTDLDVVYIPETEEGFERIPIK